MPDPARLRNTLDRAGQAFRNTPGRHGRLIHVEEADDVLVAGDLHGNVENFRRLLNVAALAKHPRRHLVLQELVHGPHRYPTGGDKSHQLVDLLAALKCQYPRQVHMLLGNHELAQWTDQWVAKGNEDFNELFRAGVASAYGAAADSIYQAYLQLFAVLPLAVRAPNRVFMSHSLPNARRMDAFDPSVFEQMPTPQAELQPGGRVHAVLWGRDTSLANVTTYLDKVDADLLITGHIPCPEGYAVPHSRQLILDSLGSPACYCLFPADRPLTQERLVACVGTL